MEVGEGMRSASPLRHRLESAQERIECEAEELNQQELKSPARRTELPGLLMWVVTMLMILCWIQSKGVVGCSSAAVR